MLSLIIFSAGASDSITPGKSATAVYLCDVHYYFQGVGPENTKIKPGNCQGKKSSITLSFDTAAPGGAEESSQQQLMQVLLAEKNDVRPQPPVENSAWPLLVLSFILLLALAIRRAYLYVKSLARYFLFIFHD